MKRLLPLLSAAVLLLAHHVVAAADDKYEVKLNSDPQVGQVTQETSYSKNVTNFKFTDAKGAVVQEMKETEIKRSEYDETCLEVKDKKAVKFSRKYTKVTIEDSKGKREPSYVKRTLTFVLKDGKYTITADDGPAIAKEDLAALKKEMDDKSNDKFTHLMEPGKAVKVGDTWSPEGKQLAEALNTDKAIQFEGGTSKAAIKLLKAYKQDKAQWGTLEATFDLTVKSLEGVTVEQGSSMNMKMTVEMPIDGSAHSGTMKMTGTFKFKGTVEAEGQKLNFVADGQMESEDGATLKKK